MTKFGEFLAGGLLVAVTDDYCEFEARLTKERGNRYWRRAYVRSAFTVIETHAYFLRLNVLAFHETGIINLSPDEFDDLRGKMATKDANGNPKEEDNFIRYRDLIKISFRASAVMYGMSADDVKNKLFGVNEWRIFSQALGVRNRLTHPKFTGDLNISDNDLHMCDTALLWVVKTTNLTTESAKRTTVQRATTKFPPDA